jgi:hypothetical protein
MRLGPDKLIISKLDNMELREITGKQLEATLTLVFKSRVRPNSKQEQILNKNRE